MLFKVPVLLLLTLWCQVYIKYNYTITITT